MMPKTGINAVNYGKTRYEYIRDNLHRLELDLDNGKIGYLRQPVKAINIDTNEKLIFESQREEARQLGINQSHINRVIRGTRKNTGLYKFERVV